jgi:hypothetical protein
MATKTRGYFLPVVSTVVLLLVGLALAIFLPLPEEKAARELAGIKIKSIRWNHTSPQQAVDELNAEIQKVSNTRYRFFLGDEASNSDNTIGLDLDDLPATECAFYLAELSSNYLYYTPQGVVIDRMHRGELYYKPSWRRDFRNWIDGDLLPYWRRWFDPPSPSPHSPFPDPFAPAP